MFSQEDKSVPADKDLQQKIKNFKTQKMILAERLDLAYEIYQLCLKSPENVSTNAAKNEALDFMKLVLDTDNEKVIPKLMEFRLKKRKASPEFIPGIAPVLTTFQSESSERKTSKWAKFADVLVTVRTGKMMKIDEESKEEDEELDTPMFDSLQRDPYRVIVKNGIFMMRDEKSMNLNDYVKADTSGYQVDDRKGQAAFAINRQGEISIFEHKTSAGKDEKESFVHSALNASANLFGAGAIDIKDGKLKMLTAESGHFLPTSFNVAEVLNYFVAHDIDVSEAVVGVYEKLPLDAVHVADSKMEEKLFWYRAIDIVSNPEAMQKFAKEPKKELSWDELDGEEVKLDGDALDENDELDKKARPSSRS
jgi:hypothetical protein